MNEVGAGSDTPYSSVLRRYRVAEPMASEVLQLVTDEFAPGPADCDSAPPRYLFDRLRVRTLISEANAWAMVRAEAGVWLFPEDGPWEDVQRFSTAMGGGRPARTHSAGTAPFTKAAGVTVIPTGPLRLAVPRLERPQRRRS